MLLSTVFRTDCRMQMHLTVEAYTRVSSVKHRKSIKKLGGNSQGDRGREMNRPGDAVRIDADISRAAVQSNHVSDSGPSSKVTGFALSLSLSHSSSAVTLPAITQYTCSCNEAQASTRYANGNPRRIACRGKAVNLHMPTRATVSPASRDEGDVLIQRSRASCGRFVSCIHTTSRCLDAHLLVCKRWHSSGLL